MLVGGATPDTWCDGLDDDCDGVADDEYVPIPTTCGMGACEGTTGEMACQGGFVFDTCDPYAAATSDTDCDGIDDDCNGLADDGYPFTPAICGLGACVSIGSSSCENGTIVVALIDNNEVTLKRLRRKGDSIALEPANQAHKTRIFGPDRVKLQGKLIGLMRKY